MPGYRHREAGRPHGVRRGNGRRRRPRRGRRPAAAARHRDELRRVTAPPDYVVQAGSTGTFGRVLLSARTQHLVVDGPAQNGCPGEAVTPAEPFLRGVATCAVELVQVLAKEQDTPLAGVEATIEGTVDRAHEVRDDVTVFRSVRLHFTMHGIGAGAAGALVEAFKGR